MKIKEFFFTGFYSGYFPLAPGTAGTLVALAIYILTIAVLAFILFRIFDILKPYPANKFQELKGGIGVMLDDYIAGVYSLITLNIIVAVSRTFHLPLGL
jgi:phosphatidylglycerophosphatase A